MSRLAAEDAEAISARMRELHAYHWRQCFGRLGLGTTNCWCFKAAENGDSLPCPPVEAAAPEYYGF